VRPDLAATLQPAFIGWAAHARPFGFEIGPVVLAPPPERFQSGTPNVPALYAARAGYEIVGRIGVEAIRARSLHLTRRLMERALADGYRLNTPMRDEERGGAVIVDLPDAEAVSQELLRREVIIDYRPGAGIRMAPHFYNTEEEIDRAMTTLAAIVDERAWTRQKAARR
jgi:kynureninase